jgi:hypothetical protein
MEQVFAAIPIMALVAYWGNNMPVQMIELEAVEMMQVSDAALESSSGLGCYGTGGSMGTCTGAQCQTITCPNWCNS